MNKRNFFYDILRDKDSYKYSTTKSFALLFTIFIITYLIIYLFIYQKPIDHALIGEVFLLIGGLLGLKNNWGKKSSNNTNSNHNFDKPKYNIDSLPRNIKKSENDDEAVF